MATSPRILAPSPVTRQNGRRIVLACLAGNFVCATPMLNATFSMFLLPITNEFGWPRSQVALGLSIVAITGLLTYPFVGRLADRYGVRPIAIIGNILFGLSLCALSRASADPWSFFGLFVLVGLCAALPSTVLYAKLISSWFLTQRGMLLGLTAGVGNGLGSTVMPALAAWLIAAHGWRGAYIGLGLVTIALGLPVLVGLLRDKMPDAPATTGGEMLPVEEGISLSSAMSRREFWVLVGAIGSSAGALTALFCHVVPILLDRGLAIDIATMTIMSFAFTCMLWQIGFGWLLDHVERPQVAIPFFLLPIAGAWLLVSTASTPLLLLGGVLMGVGLGAEYSLLPFWIPRYFGRHAYGAIYGSIYGVIALCMGLLPVLMDLSFDITGNYRIAIVAISAMLAVDALLILLLRPYAYDRTGELADPRRDGGIRAHMQGIERNGTNILHATGP